jgi:uncharacterized protein (TIGR02145 family)
MKKVFRYIILSFLFALISIVIDLLGGLLIIPFHLMSKPGKPIFEATGWARNDPNDSFPLVRIGQYEWMSKNLDKSVFQDGTEISHAKDYDEWNAFGIKGKPAWAWAEFNEENGRKYGKIYNWYAVKDTHNLAPKGWLIPDTKAWDDLLSKGRVQYCIHNGVSHTSMKKNRDTDAEVLQSTATGWKCLEDGGGLFDPTWGTDVGSNETGFDALPGGELRAGVGRWSGWWNIDGSFLKIGDHIEDRTHDAVMMESMDVGKTHLFGYYVRCVRKL